MTEMTVTGFVDGKPLCGGGDRFETINPATGKAFAAVYDAVAADVVGAATIAIDAMLHAVHS